MNKLLIVAKALLIAVFFICTILLAWYAIADSKQRAHERQLILSEAEYYKTHPLVINGCETDAECERLDEMLDVIHASYTLD